MLGYGSNANYLQKMFTNSSFHFTIYILSLSAFTFELQTRTIYACERSVHHNFYHSFSWFHTPFHCKAIESSERQKDIAILKKSVVYCVLIKHSFMVGSADWLNRKLSDSINYKVFVSRNPARPGPRNFVRNFYYKKHVTNKLTRMNSCCRTPH